MRCDGCATIATRLRHATEGHWAGKWICRECWTLPRTVDVRFGLEPEWESFEERQPRFVFRFPELQRVLDAAVSRQLESTDKADRLIFFLGRLAVEDFVEIVLNVGNGYGVAALKLLRSLSERTITMMYLIRNPGEAENFLDHEHVQRRKIVSHIKAGGADPRDYFGAKELKEIESNYAAVKAKFLEPVCKKCGTTRPGISWTKVDLATMARKVGLGQSYVGLCYFPTLQIHATASALALRMEEMPGGVTFKPQAQRDEADAAIHGAHMCISLVLEEHIAYFKLPLSIDHIRAIYHDCWPDERTPRELAAEPEKK